MDLEVTLVAPPGLSGPLAKTSFKSYAWSGVGVKSEVTKYFNNKTQKKHSKDIEKKKKNIKKIKNIFNEIKKYLKQKGNK